MGQAIYGNELNEPVQRGTDKSNSRSLWAKLILLSAIFILSLLWRAPDEPRFNLCLFRGLTGLPCPGCGMTRAFCALSHGEFLRAAHFNLLSPAIYLGFLLAWAHALASLLKLDKLRLALVRLNPRGRGAQALIVLLLVWWAARLIGRF